MPLAYDNAGQYGGRWSTSKNVSKDNCSCRNKECQISVYMLKAMLTKVHPALVGVREIPKEKRSFALGRFAFKP